MKFLILCFAAGLLVGSISVYIWQRTHTFGALKIYNEDDALTVGMGPSVFLELEKDFQEFQRRKTVTLRVENVSYYENLK